MALLLCAALAGTMTAAQMPGDTACGLDGRTQSGAAAVELSNGVLLPCVSLGTGDPVAQTKKNLQAALAVGFRGVDTALTYFDQSGVAEAIAAEVGRYPRKDIVITTKVPGGGLGVDNYKSTTLDAEANLKLLKVDYVDLLLIHWSPLIGCACGPIREQWRAMEDFYKAKKARAIGVSVSSFPPPTPTSTTG
jgi:2,5-diketo-D-gluconate reductase A